MRLFDEMFFVGFLLRRKTMLQKQPRDVAVGGGGGSGKKTQTNKNKGVKGGKEISLCLSQTCLRDALQHFFSLEKMNNFFFPLCDERLKKRKGKKKSAAPDERKCPTVTEHWDKF